MQKGKKPQECKTDKSKKQLNGGNDLIPKYKSVSAKLHDHDYLRRFTNLGIILSKTL